LVGLDREFLGAVNHQRLLRRFLKTFFPSTDTFKPELLLPDIDDKFFELAISPPSTQGQVLGGKPEARGEEGEQEGGEEKEESGEERNEKEEGEGEEGDGEENEEEEWVWVGNEDDGSSAPEQISQGDEVRKYLKSTKRQSETDIYQGFV
jgi:hypothetical protein